MCVTDLPKCPKFLDSKESNIIKDYVEVLKPTNELTNILSGKTYPTISLIVPLIRGFQHIPRYLITSTEEEKTLKNSLLEAVMNKIVTLEKDSVVAKATL